MMLKIIGSRIKKIAQRIRKLSALFNASVKHSRYILYREVGFQTKNMWIY
jgi:hypothetical protein